MRRSQLVYVFDSAGYTPIMIHDQNFRTIFHRLQIVQELFHGVLVDLAGRLVHDDQMWHIGNTRGKKNLPDVSGTRFHALQ